jgi:type II secretory ATPase GspE/PulE/Tfp pilus assembly ATPase PilB-like protein
MEEIEFLLSDYEISFLIKPVEAVEQILKQHYNSQLTEIWATNNHETLIKKLIAEAKELKTSDIHLESTLDGGRIRMRIDGHMTIRYSLNKDEYLQLVNQVKIQSELDISQKRIPQDGRISFKDQSETFDLRVSTITTLHGEKIVLRILRSDASSLTFEDIGIPEDLSKELKLQLIKPHGLILISGPTGSGKTTTLYSILKQLNKENKNILTIEDPIEYTLPGLNQVQVNEDIGLTFPLAIRSFLRQDPDIIIVGEIRDEETAKTAIRAALTGHLVISTIHTNSAFESLKRLIEMNVPDYLVKSTLNLSISQRLVRKLCSNCSENDTLTRQLFRIIPTNVLKEIESFNLKKEKGCSNCNYSGYDGRIALFEYLQSDQLILLDSEKQLTFESIPSFSKLRDQAILLIKDGQTSIDEVLPYLI